MKNLILKSLTCAAFVVSFSVSCLAQTTPAQVALYEKFTAAAIKSTDPAQQKVAYELGKEYLGKYGSPEDQYNKYVRSWTAKYEKALLAFNFDRSMTLKIYTDGFRYGKEILAAEPERLDILIPLSLAPLQTSGTALDTDGMIYAQKAIKLIEAGKQPEFKLSSGEVVKNWMQFGSKDDTLAALNYALGAYASRAGKHQEAVIIFHRVAAGPSTFSKQPLIYLYLGNAYVQGHYKKREADYNRLLQKTPAQPDNPETRAARAKAFAVLDYVIDAYARAVALSNDPKDAAQKESAMKFLTTAYKARNNDSDAGLKELIAKILTNRLPSPLAPQ